MSIKKLQKNFYRFLFVIVLVVYLWQMYNPSKESKTTETFHPEDSKATVYKVIDGDTLDVRLENQEKTTRIRIYGMDAPELDQAYGKQSKAALEELLDGKEIQLKVEDTDQYSRKVARVFVEDQEITALMIKEGNAWLYTYYCKIKECAQWKEFTKQAQKAHKGIWQDQNSIPPWKWRKERKNKKTN